MYLLRRIIYGSLNILMNVQDVVELKYSKQIGDGFFDN
jgi:hypothetical protein